MQTLADLLGTYTIPVPDTENKVVLLPGDPDPDEFVNIFTREDGSHLHNSPRISSGIEVSSEDLLGLLFINSVPTTPIDTSPLSGAPPEFGTSDNIALIGGALSHSS